VKDEVIRNCSLKITLFPYINLGNIPFYLPFVFIRSWKHLKKSPW